MRYFEFVADTEFLGTSVSEVMALEDDEVENFPFDEYIEDMARDNAESYSYFATGYGEDWESVEEEEEYYENAQACSYYNEITEAQYLELLEELK